MKPRLAIPAVLTLMTGGLVFGPTAPALARVTPHLAAPHATAITPNGAWTTYHRDNAHTGFDSTLPAATGATTGWVSPTLDESVFTEPLVYQGIVYVATLNNTVYALNQTDGSVVWSKNVGAPQTSGWQCGNINPTGMLGTGVIDTARSRLYVVGFLSQFASYYLFAFDLATGTRAFTTQILPTGFDWRIQQQRGALALSTDGTHVYVPFGGRAGDCGPYHGWVEGVPTAGGVADEHYETPSTGEGIWAAGGVVVDDSTGNALFATGNAIPCSGALDSDSVIRTNASLAALAFFQPLDWSNHWCGPDSDLGSTSPILISPTLAFMAGKYGQGFLINPTTMAGTNTQVFPAPSPYVGADVCFGNHFDATFGSFAYAAPRVYLECENHGIVSLTVNPSAPSFSLCNSSCTATGTWQAGGTTTFGPPIVAAGMVWATNNGGGLFGFDAATGALLYQSGPFGVTRFSTPSEAGGQIFVAADTVVRSFNIGGGCTTMSATATPPSTATVGTLVAVTGTASGTGTGCSNPNYQFWLLPPNGIWSVVQPYSASATFNWSTAGMSPGAYRFSVWARQAGRSNSYDSFSAFPYTLTITNCSGMSASSAPPSTATVGTLVTVTGSATGCSSPLYEFWLLPPGGAWSLVRGYSTTATFNWATTGAAAGAYRFSVWARDASSPGTNGTAPYTYDAFSAFQYTLTTTSCSGMSASAAPPTSATVGTTVTVTGSATGCPSPLYQFWLLPPGGTWYVARAYSTGNTFNWNTAGLAAGSYRFSVWTRDGSSPGSSGTVPYTYDAFSAFPYALTISPCTGMSASAAPPTTATRGTTVTITGSATGCPNALYEFWMLPPGGTWTLVSAYSASATFTWNSTNQPAGSYRFSVWARDASSTGTNGTPPYTYDAFSAFQYTLT